MGQVAIRQVLKVVHVVILRKGGDYFLTPMTFMQNPTKDEIAFELTKRYGRTYGMFKSHEKGLTVHGKLIDVEIIPQVLIDNR